MASATVSSSSSSGGGSSSVSNSGGGSKASSTDTGSKKTADTKSEKSACSPTSTKDGTTLTAEAKTRETSNAPDMGALLGALGEQPAAWRDQLGTDTMRKGADGESVTALQSALNEKMGLSLDTDGKFGPLTLSAVKDFQRQNGLAVDGIVGTDTRAALLAEQDQVQPAKPLDPKDGLIFGNKLTAEEQQKVRDVAASLGADPNDLMAVMAAETGGTFDPAERAGKNGAVGLIQFTNTAITEMNKGLPRDQQLSKASLEQMSFTEQMDHVQDYLQTMMDRYNGPANPDRGDLYAAVFSPALVDNSDTSRIYGGNSREYRANKSLDTNRDGWITRNELTARADEWYERGLEVMA